MVEAQVANRVPNFDAMTNAELMAFWKRYTRPTRKDAEALVGDRRPGFTNLSAKLANYACNKATAMTCRLKGDVRAASIYEAVCDRIYGELPADLRW